MSRPIPLYVAILLAGALAGLAVFHVAEAQTSFTLTRPYVASISIVSSSLRPTGFAMSSPWTQATVNVTNTGTASQSGVVTVEFYEGDVRIAYGSAATGTIIPGGQVTLVVTVTWQPGKMMEDATGGRVTVG